MLAALVCQRRLRQRGIDRGLALVADYLDEKYPGVGGHYDDSGKTPAASQ